MPFSTRPLSPAHFSNIPVPGFAVIAQSGEMSAPADGGAGGAAGGEPQVMVAGVGEIQIAQGERITSLLQQNETLVSEKAGQEKACEAEKTRLCGEVRERQGIIAGLKSDDDDKNELIAGLKAKDKQKDKDIAALKANDEHKDKDIAVLDTRIASREDWGGSSSPQNFRNI